MYRHAIIFSMLLILLIPAMALAQADREGRMDFSLQTLYTTAQDYSGDGGSKLSLDQNLGWAFGFNYHFTDNFDLGGAFRLRSINYKATAIDADNPGNTYEYGSRLDVSTIALTGNWNMLDGPITPYLGGSVGWTLIDTNIVAGISSGCWWEPWWGYRCGSWPVTYGTSTASYTLGAGVRLQITDSVFFRAGYEYGGVSSGVFDDTNMLRIDIGFMTSGY